MTTPPEPWVPKSADEWADVFAKGIALDRSRQAEEAAKAAAAAGDQKTDSDKEKGEKPKSWAERLLG